MTLPIAISLPHAGLHVPAEAAPYCQLTREQLSKDGDEGASEIYALQDEVAEFITTDVARAIVDLNRSPDDRRSDGVRPDHSGRRIHFSSNGVGARCQCASHSKA